MNGLGEWWRARAPRERRFLLAGCLVLGGLAGDTLLWQPLAAARARLHRTAPTALAEADALGALAPEKRRTPDAAAIAAVFRKSGAQVTAAGGGAWRVTAERADLDACLAALARLSREMDVRVRLAQIQPAGGAGQVRIDLVLARRAP